MSIPQGSKVIVNLCLPASQALALARNINYWLSRAQDFQEGEIASGQGREYEHTGPGNKHLLYMLGRIQVNEGVTISILPDQRVPGSSGYGYFSGPEKEQYLPIHD